MLKRSRIAALLITVALSLAMGGLAFAHEVPDLEQTGAVEVTMKLGEEPVGGGAMALYRVGDIQEEDGNYSFVLTKAFAGSGVSLEDIQSADVAQSLANYATANKLSSQVQEEDGNYSFVLTKAFAGSGVSLEDIQSADVAQSLANYATANKLSSQVKRIGASGVVTFDNLPVGLYLLVQTRAATGYSATNPFLAAVPTLIEGTYYYKVDASPKVEFEKEPTNPPTDPNKPSKVPQTADDTMPVGPLACAGAVLLATGAVLVVMTVRRAQKAGR